MLTRLKKIGALQYLNSQICIFRIELAKKQIASIIMTKSLRHQFVICRTLESGLLSPQHNIIKTTETTIRERTFLSLMVFGKWDVWDVKGIEALIIWFYRYFNSRRRCYKYTVWSKVCEHLTFTVIWGSLSNSCHKEGIIQGCLWML